MDLASAAHELYGVPPSDFTAVRKRLTDEAHGTGLAGQIGKLRRPTLSAWAVNLLSRQAAPELGDLLDVGDRLRAAWATGDQIGGLEQRRSELITLLVRTAGRLAAEAGHPLRDPAVREVEATLQAATIDPEVAEEVRTGRLTQARSYAGFAPAGFPATPQARPPAPRSVPKSATKQAKQAKRQDEAERRRAEEERRRRAEEAVRKAEEAAAEWAAAAGTAREELTAIGAEADRLKQELDEVLARRTAAERRLRVAEREHNRATRTAEEARRKL